jgi:imidazolonepropionase
VSAEPADLLVVHAGELATLAGPAPRTGPALRDVGALPDGAVAIRGEHIAAVGPTRELERRFRAARTIDASGRLVTPGLIDAHTHPVFVSLRAAEFEMRLQGRTYQEIAAAGGGIRSTVAGVRAADDDALARAVEARLRRFLAEGTTTIEAKSGYGLTLADELRSLRAIREAARRVPVGVAPTLLGAHDVPPEFREDREGYVRLVAEEMVPAAAREGLAEFCDAFVERGFFTVEDGRALFRAARAHGLRPRLHADEFSDCGGAALAAEVGAISADHLLHVSDAGIEALRRAGVVPVLLPGTHFSLGLPSGAPARRMIEAGLPVALATDCNPGTSLTESLPMVMTLACVLLRMTPAEALAAVTVNAAAALARAHDRGRLEPGLRADLVVWDVPDHRALPYYYGVGHAETVVAGGRPVWEKKTHA